MPDAVNGEMQRETFGESTAESKGLYDFVREMRREARSCGAPNQNMYTIHRIKIGEKSTKLLPSKDFLTNYVLRR